jgi:hypothetical protein
VNIFSSMMAAMGRQLKQSVNVFHNFMLYRRLPGTHVSSVGKEKTPARTFIVKAVNPVDACALVVSAQDEKILGVLDLVRQQQANRLERLLPAVNVVAEEEIVRLGREAPVLEQPQQVVVLPMDIPCAGVSAIISSERAHDAPHILIGASSSSKMGWLMNISRALVQRYLISYSWSWTGLPGRLPRTGQPRQLGVARMNAGSQTFKQLVNDRVEVNLYC